jgi:tripartite-type tricarboxylate transporter receptor subunit TctC
MAGDLIMSMVDTGPAIPQITAGNIRALAVTSPTRLPNLPNVPTMAELGLPDIEFRYWAGVFAPTGTPAAVVKKLEAEIAKVLRLPEVVAQMAVNQVTATSSTSEELSKLLVNDLARWAAVADGARMKRDGTP